MDRQSGLQGIMCGQLHILVMDHLRVQLGIVSDEEDACPTNHLRHSSYATEITAKHLLQRERQEGEAEKGKNDRKESGG